MSRNYRQILRESMRHPAILQGYIGDANDRNPAGGLLQFIPGTFHYWQVGGRGDRFNPLDNILGAVNAQAHGPDADPRRPLRLVAAEQPQPAAQPPRAADRHPLTAPSHHRHRAPSGSPPRGARPVKWTIGRPANPRRARAPRARSSGMDTARTTDLTLLIAGEHLRASALVSEHFAFTPDTLVSLHMTAARLRVASDLHGDYTDASELQVAAFLGYLLRHAIGRYTDLTPLHEAAALIRTGPACEIETLMEPILEDLAAVIEEIAGAVGEHLKLTVR